MVKVRQEISGDRRRNCCARIGASRGVGHYSSRRSDFRQQGLRYSGAGACRARRLQLGPQPAHGILAAGHFGGLCRALHDIWSWF